MRPGLKQALLRVLGYFPSLKNRLKRISFQFENGTTDYFKTRANSDLSPRAAQILRDLKQALSRD